MLEQRLGFGRWKLVLAYSSCLLRKRMTGIVRSKELFVCWSNGWFWKLEVSIGVQFLFAAQKDDSESGDQRTVRVLEQWLVLEGGSMYWPTVPICCAKG